MDKQFEATMVQEVGFCTDVGQMREMNEDFIDVGYISPSRQSYDEPVGVYALADGMGGHAQGEIASRLAVQTLIRTLKDECAQLSDSLPNRCPDCLEEAFHLANVAVKSGNRERGTNMGTTLVAAVVANHEAYIANVGDSRAYVIAQMGIRQITHDQTVAQKLYERGTITQEQLEDHPYQHVLTQAIGLEDNLQVDLFTVNLNPGEYLLLCSDGLTKELDDQIILRIVQRAYWTQGACKALVDAANNAGGYDNISAVLVRLTENDAA